MYQDLVVQEMPQGNFLFPPKLLRPRGHNAMIFALSCAIVLFSVAIMLNCSDTSNYGEVISYIFQAECVYLLALGLAELVWRFSILWEELSHLEGRYGGNWKLLVWNAASLEYISMIVFVFIIICLLWYRNEPILENICKLNGLSWVCLVVASQLMMKYVKLDKNQLAKSILLETMQPLDYGSGMAYNFFYGYLHIVLPDTGDSSKGLKERILDYMGKERLEDDHFPVRKLFILIPASSYTPPNLAGISDDWMTPAGNLEKQVKNRAGVMERVYKNSVYQIQDPKSSVGPVVYVVAEGATPLKTLYDVVEHSGVQQEFFKEHHKTIVYMFYTRLQEILRNDRDCKDLCELVYYVDTDEHGNPNVNVGLLLLEKIEEIKQREALRLQQTRRNT